MIRGTAAFTLIELLTVISILALLAAILFPVFGRARESARRTTCLSNLRQIGLGMQQYLSDSDDTFPWLLQEGGNGQINGTSGFSTDKVSPGPPDMRNRRGAFLEYALHPYVRSLGIYQCPTNETYNIPTDAQGVPTFPGRSYTFKYCGIGANPSPVMGVLEQLVRLGPTLAAIGVPPEGTSGDPQAYCVAGQPLVTIDDPTRIATVLCYGYGEHFALKTEDVVPKILGGNGREEVGGSLAVYADGHAGFRTGRFGALLSSLVVRTLRNPP